MTSIYVGMYYIYLNQINNITNPGEVKYYNVIVAYINKT